MLHTHTIPFTILHDLGIVPSDNLFDGNEDMLVDCFSHTQLIDMHHKLQKLLNDGTDWSCLPVTEKALHDYGTRLRWAMGKQVRKGCLTPAETKEHNSYTVYSFGKVPGFVTEGSAITTIGRFLKYEDALVSAQLATLQCYRDNRLGSTAGCETYIIQGTDPYGETLVEVSCKDGAIQLGY